MDVELPNGTVISDVPEGTNRYKVMEMAIAHKLATPEDFGQESAHAGGSFWEGIGRGLTHTARSLGNMVGVVGDKELADSEDLDKDLLSTGAGQAGNFVGEMAATLPVGGAVGGLAKAATAARGVVPGARLAASVLGNGVSRAALEGAVGAGATADSDQRGGMAMFGAGLGGAMGGAGKLLKLGVNKLTPKITPEAAQLQKMTGTFIPLSQALEPGVGKQFYEAFLANLPGVGGKIRGQYKNAIEDLRRYAAEQAHPPTAPVTITPKDTIADAFGKLEDYWKTAYDGIGAVPIKLFNGAGGRQSWKVPLEVEEAMKAASGGRFAPPPVGATVSGEVMVNLKRATEELLEKVPEGSTLKAAAKKELEDFSEHIDDMLKQNLDPTGKGKGKMADVYRDYLDKQPYYEDYQRLLSAGQKAVKARGVSDFSPAELAASSARQTGTSAVRGGGAGSMQETGRLGAATLPDFPSRQGLFQTAAALGLGGSFLAGGGVPVAAGAAGMMGVGRALASPRAQKLVSGQYDVMKHYSKLLRRMGMASRNAAVIGGTDVQRQ